MTGKHPRKARVLHIDSDGNNAEIEFVEQHGELVIGGYVLTGQSEATAAEAAGAEIDPTPGQHLPWPEGPETIELPHRNPRNARVLRIDADGKNAKVEFVDQHGDPMIGTYVLAVWNWAPAAERARGQKVLDGSPLVIYGRRASDRIYRQ